MSRTWRSSAACRGTDPELFFDPARVLEAKSICASCPVMAVCLADQLAWEAASAPRRYYASGVSGGLSGTERHRIHYPRTSMKEVA